MTKKPVFKDYTEYLYYTRYLSREQRKIIFKSLPVEQKEHLESSYIKEGWCDLFYRNEINEKIDELKESYGYDIIEIRCKVLKRKSVYIPSKFWIIVEEQFEQFRLDAIKFVIGGLEAIPCDKNEQVSLVVYNQFSK